MCPKYATRHITAVVIAKMKLNLTLDLQSKTLITKAIIAGSVIAPNTYAMLGLPPKISFEYIYPMKKAVAQNIIDPSSVCF